MPAIQVGALKFTFPEGWRTEQLDEWSYYRNQFLNLGNNVRLACSACSAELRCAACSKAKVAGMKGCDLVALRAATAWLIEVKDYRQHPRVKAIGLADEAAIKVRDSLAVLLGGQDASKCQQGESVCR
jgi:hypothetical protein